MHRLFKKRFECILVKIIIISFIWKAEIKFQKTAFLFLFTKGGGKKILMT